MKRWRYTPAPDLELSPVERLRCFPREPDMLVYGLRSVVSLAIRGALGVYHRLGISGAEHLPHDRSFILVANHASHLDTVCLLAALPFRKVHCAFPAAAADYFFRSVARTWIATIITNALPFGRNGNIRHTLTVCDQLLANSGNILIIFPEGTRTRDGRLQEFKPGIGALVAGRDVAVLPCYIDGSFRAWPKGQRLPLPRKVRLTIGTARNFAARSNDKASIAAIASELRAAVNQLARDFRRTQDAELGRPGAVLPLVDSARADG
jgi:1-acyl-sn-glycerol-3-phosphate acyltransferase